VADPGVDGRTTGITVQFVGPVRRPTAARSIEVDVLPLRTVGDLLQELGYSRAEWFSLHVLVDGSRKEPDTSLEGARLVEILVAIGGG
jgi:hypothetical protein